MTATAEKTATAPAKLKGPPPVINGITMTEAGWKDTVALWLNKEGATAKLQGFIMDGDQKISVLGFINTKEDNGTKYTTLSKSTDGVLVKVAYGHAINSHKDGSAVHFDTIAFNFGDKTVFGRLTGAASAELQKELGFTSARVPRPSRVDHSEDSEAAMEAETAGAGERPRG